MLTFAVGLFILENTIRLHCFIQLMITTPTTITISGRTKTNKTKELPIIYLLHHICIVRCTKDFTSQTTHHRRHHHHRIACLFVWIALNSYLFSTSFCLNSFIQKFFLLPSSSSSSSFDWVQFCTPNSIACSYSLRAQTYVCLCMIRGKAREKEKETKREKRIGRWKMLCQKK